MARQKCGTCRFFQEAGLAGSGWCHHPQRKVSSDVMIMVRRSELACRDDWSQSLWEPVQGGEQQEPAYRRPATLGPTPPASLENMRSLLHADTTVAGEALEGEDVLLSEGRIISEAPQPLAQPTRPALSAPAGGFDPRTAVMKAREAYRDRARARDAAARQSARAEAIAAPVNESSQEEPAREIDRELLTTAAASSSLRVEAESSNHFAPGDHIGAGEPDLAWVGERDDDQPPKVEGGGVFGREVVREPEEREHDETIVDRLESGDQNHNGIAANGTLPAWYRTDLPKVCRTCRDYRPSTEGGRGWCANAWAFTHRRLVQEDDAAPCASSFGDWWAPVDDVWLVAADVSSHGRATPLLDRLTTQERDKRKRS